jgi:hypothetical protein
VSPAASSAAKSDISTKYGVCGTGFDPLPLQCGRGYLISSVDFASYGLPLAQSCMAYQRQTCHTVNSSVVVEKECLNRELCTVSVNSANFGTPCDGGSSFLAARVTCSGPAPSLSRVQAGSMSIFAVLTADQYGNKRQTLDSTSSDGVVSASWAANPTTNVLSVADRGDGSYPVTYSQHQCLHWLGAPATTSASIGMQVLLLHDGVRAGGSNPVTVVAEPVPVSVAQSSVECPTGSAVAGVGVSCTIRMRKADNSLMGTSPLASVLMATVNNQGRTPAVTVGFITTGTFSAIFTPTDAGIVAVGGSSPWPSVSVMSALVPAADSILGSGLSGFVDAGGQSVVGVVAGGLARSDNGRLLSLCSGAMQLVGSVPEASEGKNKLLTCVNTLVISTHMHKAPSTQHTPPRPRVPQHAHARTAPRLGAAGGAGGQCASPTASARGGYTYLSLVKRMCLWLRPSRASPFFD